MNAKFLLTLLSLFPLITAAPMVSAQESNIPGTSSEGDQRSQGASMEECLSQVKSFNGRINKRAKYYIYLQSASWCGPCQQEMPEIAKLYRKMKRKGVEIILCSLDETTEDAKRFLKAHKAKFPAIMLDDAEKLPGFFVVGAVPAAVIVTASGENIVTGHGAIIKDWKSIIEEWESAHATEDDAS